MNILILSVGTRNKIIRWFKEALNGDGKVIATDMSELAPALYEADRHYIVPPISDPKYIGTVLDICKENKINAVLSLIDPELSLLAKHNAEFSEIGVKVIVSSYELCERSLNKMQTYGWLKEHGYRCAKSYDSKEAFTQALLLGNEQFPVIVKPTYGSASVNVNKADDMTDIDFYLSKSSNMMIQRYMQGTEIGVDVYVDMISHEPVCIFTKVKKLMRSGETNKAVSMKDEKLFDLIDRFVSESGFVGPIDIDVFEVDGEYYISEVNPRFGGGYPLAYMAGCNFMSFIVNNLQGQVNEKNIGNYEEGICMMKYNETLIRSQHS